MQPSQLAEIEVVYPGSLGRHRDPWVQPRDRAGRVQQGPGSPPSSSPAFSTNSETGDQAALLDQQ